ncbi:hypothetical protein STVIR_7357 [Streptomyces viridochromogenes Tue57]|uniref:Uncharacterized protein n=1 Tax=Streptomyces viridochromogenes Tue57 TaxID=1160705 RepID=L8P8S2_STRVR|nr:hypothetical protein STVIR_7357 [Streptomyces viridochromogenes Tue57]
MNPTAVRPPRGVRKRRAAQAAGPGRTGTYRGPAGNRSEGSGSSPDRMAAMGCLRESPRWIGRVTRRPRPRGDGTGARR